MIVTAKLVFFGLFLVLCVVSVPVIAGDVDDGYNDDTPPLKVNPPLPKKMWPLNATTGMIEVPIAYNVSQYSKRIVVSQSAIEVTLNLFLLLNLIAAEQLAVHRQGLYDIQNKTCIRFVDTRPSDKDSMYVRDDYSGKCNSPVGRKGGVQYINFSPACMLVRKKCIHEVIHGLGFRHMVSSLSKIFLLNLFYCRNIMPAPTLRSRHVLDRCMG